jgi:hypothetical protein
MGRSGMVAGVRLLLRAYGAPPSGFQMRDNPHREAAFGVLVFVLCLEWDRAKNPFPNRILTFPAASAGPADSRLKNRP